ncbi:MAG: transposase zinc-binding domain-containing protein [Candidatus Aegiribacteria sp.]|nr:transposase zinc-binding domain-containing protein [Candidatus Aegiribacteria sp.]
MYDERFSKRYGFWRSVTDEVVGKYLQCGDPHFGFARIRCRECGAEYLRAFSCKYRGFRDLPGTSCFWLCWFQAIIGGLSGRIGCLTGRSWDCGKSFVLLIAGVNQMYNVTGYKFMDVTLRMTIAF